MASALTRSLPSGKELTTSASTAGEASAPPTPWMARAASSMPAVVARPPASEASVKMVRPAMNIRRRPRMSPARPPSSSSPPNVGVYPFITQDRLVEEKCRLVWMCGSAMFTTVASRMIMSWALSMMARARPARLVGLAASIRASWVRKEDNMPPWRSGSGALGGAGIPEEPSEDLWWLTDRWPGGTIGNEAEVYSGYYTEAASALQPYLRLGP